MKNCITHFRTMIPALVIALGVSILSSPAVQAAGEPSIVGLWRVHYFVSGTQIFQTYDQWHRDGLEFEVNSIYPGAVCQGVFETENGVVHLHHVIWTFDANGVLNGHIDEMQMNVVDGDGDAYRGTFDLKAYDLNGKFLGETTGNLRATRITVK